MSAYSQEEQEKIQAQELVREWQRSEFLAAEQAAKLEAELRVDLRRTNSFLRGVLFLFTALIVGASVGFVAAGLHLDNRFAVMTLCAISSVACIVVAQLLVDNFRLYRFGIEEALAVGSGVLLTIAVMAMFGEHELPVIPGLLTGAAAGLGIYLWFGYYEAAVISMVCAAFIPWDMTITPEMKRLLTAAVLTAIFVFVRRLRRQHTDDFPGNQYAILQAAAWAGIYIALNLQFGWLYPHDSFYWFTYAMTFILPIVGMPIALREKDRPLILVTLGMALTTLMTNKPYLGLERKAWDPILFGLFLIATAVVIKRWLSNGPNAERHGFTAKRLLAKDRRIMAVVGTASAAFHPGLAASSESPTAAKPEFDGGRSGGAGASGSF